MLRFVVCVLISLPFGYEIVSLAGSALASGGTILVPASLAGSILVLWRWHK